MSVIDELRRLNRHILGIPLEDVTGVKTVGIESKLREMAEKVCPPALHEDETFKRAQRVTGYDPDSRVIAPELPVWWNADSVLAAIGQPSKKSRRG